MIVIHEFGDVPGIDVPELAVRLAEAAGLQTEPGTTFPLPPGWLDHRRNQFPSVRFLEALANLRGAQSGDLQAADRPLLLGLTDVDLFAPQLNFVFGQADVAGGVAVVSTHRLRPQFYGEAPDARLLAERTLKEAVHETGHLLGLGHCPDRACVMWFSNSIKETDAKGLSFCGGCGQRTR
jgi:archaemetzincin